MKMRTGSWGVPASIVIAGALIAGALYSANTRTLASSGSPSGSPHGGGIDAQNFRLPDESDHVRGNPDARVSVVEFSDLECPFCARLHPTLKRIVEENTDVKWVYRHFPLTSIHTRAQAAAVASECIARLGGNDAFWAFTDQIFSDQASRLNDSFYKEFAASRGVDGAAFEQCTADRSVAAEVAADNREAFESGGQGTPFAVVVTASGSLVPFSGALAYEDVRGLVDQAIAN